VAEEGTAVTVSGQLRAGKLAVAQTDVAASLAMGGSASRACPSGVTKLLRTYTPGDFGISGDFVPTSVTFGIQEVATPSTTATVTLYTLSGDFVFGNMTPIGSGQVTVTDDFGSWYEVPIEADATIAPDDILVVEVAGTAIYVGGNPSAETSPTYLASDGCGTP
jgi:hypothetical protein